MKNLVILIGRLGQDPEIKTVGETKLAKLTLATSESYKDKSGNKVENTEWHNLELWDGLAKIAESYLKKGSLIYVEGKIKTDKWENESGEKRSAVKIRVTSLQMLGSRDGQEKAENQSMKQPAPNQVPIEDDGADELPF